MHYTTLRATALHCTTLITPPHMQLQLRHTNYTKPQLQLHYTAAILSLQLHYTTLHPAVVGEVTDQVTTATIVTTPKKHNSNHLFSPSVDSLCHPWFTTTNVSYIYVSYFWNFRNRLVRCYWYASLSFVGAQGLGTMCTIYSTNH